jgi:hypothetical protein
MQAGLIVAGSVALYLAGTATLEALFARGVGPPTESNNVAAQPGSMLVERLLRVRSISDAIALAPSRYHQEELVRSYHPVVLAAGLAGVALLGPRVTAATLLGLAISLVSLTYYSAPWAATNVYAFVYVGAGTACAALGNLFARAARRLNASTLALRDGASPLLWRHPAPLLWKHLAEPDRGGLSWPATLGGGEQPPRRRWQWCTGSPGIGVFFAEAADVLGEGAFLETAKAVGESTWAYREIRPNPSQCHGLAGNADLFLQLHRLTRDPVWWERTQDFVRRAFAYRATTPDGEAWPADDADAPGLYSPDFTAGGAGVGHFFLRVLAPDRVRMPLL